MKLDDEEEGVCPLCKRPLGKFTSTHHMVPASLKGSKNKTAEIHQICHDKIHSIFTERELKNHYNTFERILENKHIQAFVKWVRAKDPNFYERTKDQRERKRKRRR